jgi:hypothetical protein
MIAVASLRKQAVCGFTQGFDILIYYALSSLVMVMNEILKQKHHIICTTGFLKKISKILICR